MPESELKNQELGEQFTATETSGSELCLLLTSRVSFKTLFLNCINCQMNTEPAAC